MKIFKTLALMAAVALMAVSCSDSKSYADLLAEEDYYSNNYLADQRVVSYIPEDSVFEYGPNAPFYRVDADGMLYMKVLDPGTKDNMVEDNEQIYFRYTRYALAGYSNGKLPTGEGNNISLSAAWFRFNNYQDTVVVSLLWGVGIQRPLDFLPIDCEVLMLIKSQMGPTSEQSNVQPYLYRLTYERRQ